MNTKQATDLVSLSRQFDEATGPTPAALSPTEKSAALDAALKMAGITDPDVIAAFIESQGIRPEDANETVREHLKESTQAKQDHAAEQIRAKLAEKLTAYQADLARGVSIEAPEMLALMDKIRELSQQAKAGDKVSLSPDSWAAIKQAIKTKPLAHKSRFEITDKGDQEDRFLSFPTGALSFIVAPSGHGKTTLLMDLLADAIKDHPTKRHWLFSFEEQASDVYLKTFNAWANTEFSKGNMRTMEHYIKHEDAPGNEKVKYFRAPTGEHYQDVVNDFEDKMKTFAGYVDQGSLNIKQGDFMAEDLAQGIRKLAKDSPGLVLIDYAQLLYLDNPGRGVERREELKRIMLMLKDVAVDTGLCIILAAQFSREVTHASNIHMSAIADAADIERAAAMVIGLWNGNKGAMVTPAEKDGADRWDAGAGIVKDPENDGGTLYLKILKYRGGVSERWATYPFKGNRLHIGREPVKCGCGEPFAGSDGKAGKKGNGNREESDPDNPIMSKPKTPAGGREAD